MIPALLVRTVSYDDARRYEMCNLAFDAEGGEQACIDECSELGISIEDQKRMAYIYNQGWRTAIEQLIGPEEIQFVGITNDGICLFAEPSKCEVGPQRRLRYEDEYGHCSEMPR
jgi:hypothetical protein